MSRRGSSADLLLPFPVPTKVLDRTVGVLKQAVSQARLGNDEKLQAIRRLDAQARLLEPSATGPSLEDCIAGERRDSHGYGGRSVFGWEKAPEATARVSSSERGTSRDSLALRPA